MNSSLPALLALALALAPAARSSDSPLPSLGVVANSGFCFNGVWERTRWPRDRQPDGFIIWGSFCDRGDGNLGRMEFQEFLAPSALNLYLAGYPGSPGLRLILKNVQSALETELKPQSAPKEEWRFDTLPIPPEWIGKPVQLIVEDSAPRSWLAFSVPVLPSSLLLPAIDTSVPEGGFCPDGAYRSTKWPDGVRPPGIVTWGSFCQAGDAGTGWTASQPIIVGSYLSFYVAGYPGKPGLRLAAENVQTGRQLLLHVPATPAESWHLYHFPLPDDWKGQSVRIVAGDRETASGGWLAFSEPIPTDLKAEASSAAKTLTLVLTLAILLFLPSVAACMLGALRNITDLLDLTAIAFLALGLTGYAAFWTYFCGRVAGNLFCYAGLLASCAVIAYVSLAKAKSRRSKVGPVKQLIAPGILVVLASIFIVSLGLLQAGEANPLSVARYRFSPPLLVGDNELPKLLADAVYAGHIPKPLEGDWLSSDRPPLQAGNTLWIYTWTSGDRYLPYLALSVILQCSFLAALWSFLTACNIHRQPLALALATCLFSGLTLLNGFFTWPKLFPVAFLLIVISYLLTGRYHLVRDRVIIGAMVGATAALAMLCHGGSTFALLGIGACTLLLRRYPGRRFLLAAAVAAALLYIPWMLYQKLYNPPGDRLLKWHLAGVIEPHPEVSFTRLLFGSYGKLNLSQLVELKVSNFKNIAGDLPEYLDDAGAFSAALVTGPVSARNAAAGFLRRTMVRHWIPSIGLAILGPLALLWPVLSRRRRGEEFTAACRIWLLTGLTLVLWSLILFGPEATIPHQGTYLTEILAFSGSCLTFWAVSPRLAVAVTAVQIAWTAVLFIWLTPVALPLVVGVDTGPANFFLAAACLLSAAAIFALLAAATREQDASITRVDLLAAQILEPTAASSDVGQPNDATPNGAAGKESLDVRSGN